MTQQVIMAVARTDVDGTLLRPDVSVHTSIFHAQARLLEIVLPLNEAVSDEHKLESLDDPRVLVQANLTGTTSIDIDIGPIQVCATIKVLA